MVRTGTGRNRAELGVFGALVHIPMCSESGTKRGVTAFLHENPTERERYLEADEEPGSWVNRLLRCRATLEVDIEDARGALSWTRGPCTEMKKNRITAPESMRTFLIRPLGSRPVVNVNLVSHHPLPSSRGSRRTAWHKVQAFLSNRSEPQNERIIQLRPLPNVAHKRTHRSGLPSVLSDLRIIPRKNGTLEAPQDLNYYYYYYTYQETRMNSCRAWSIQISERRGSRYC